MRIQVTDGLQVAKRVCYLAWQACRKPMGMGWLQDNPGATEDDVWKGIAVRSDYPPTHPGVIQDNPDTYSVYADYVFGRMMKLGFKFGPDWVEYDDQRTPRGDYQAWCVKYPTYQALLDAALKSLEGEKA